MAALDFPDTPTTGQLYGSSGTVWRWDGARWASTAGASGARGRVAYAETYTAVVGITTATVILTVTASVVAGRTYRISAQAPMVVSNPNIRGNLAIDEASVQVWAQTFAECQIAAAGADTMLYTQFVFTAPATATRTFRSYVKPVSGTANMSAAAYQSAYLLVEDITYEAGTSGTPGSSLTGLESQRPGGSAGSTYFATDTKRQFLHDGTGWIIMSEPSQPFTFTITQGVLVAYTQPNETAWFQRSNGIVDARITAYIGGSGNAGWGVTVAATGLPTAPDRSSAGTFMYYDSGVLLHHGIAGWTPGNGNIPLITQGQTGGWPSGYTTQMSSGDGLEINLRYRMTSKYS